MPRQSNRQVLAGFEPPADRRRGSFVIRMALQRLAMRQHPAALRAAGRMAVILPLAQTLLLLGLLHAPLWQGLLGAEGFVVALLAASQLSRGNLESKFIGYGIALLNTAALGVVGIVLGGHLFWICGLISILPITWLCFGVTGARTVRRGWLAFAIPLVLLAGACGVGRYALEASSNQPDPATRQWQLDAAWAAFALRGGNGTERAVLRLRQAQAAFDAGDYDRAFACAHDGAFDATGRSRVPASEIGADLLDSLMRLKAQAFYNQRWGKTDRIWLPIKADPLPPELLHTGSLDITWAW